MHDSRPINSIDDVTDEDYANESLREMNDLFR